MIGPLGDDQHNMLGPWWGEGGDADAVSLLTGLRGQAANVTFTPGCTLEDEDPGFYGNDGRFLVETGRIDVYAGSSSRADLRSSFTVTR